MNRIRELRNEADMKQAELANRVGIGQNTISNWENERTQPDFDQLEAMSKIFDVSVDYILGISPHRASTGREILKVPVLGEVAAGIPIMAVENIIDYEEIDTATTGSGEFFGLRIKGASMEPRVREGDVVIVRKQDQADTGDVAVVMVNGDSATVKRIKITPDGISLIPNNPAYEVMFYSNSEIESLPVRIIGKVVELRGKM